MTERSQFKTMITLQSILCLWQWPFCFMSLGFSVWVCVCAWVKWAKKRYCVEEKCVSKRYKMLTWPKDYGKVRPHPPIGYKTLNLIKKDLALQGCVYVCVCGWAEQWVTLPWPCRLAETFRATCLTPLVAIKITKCYLDYVYSSLCVHVCSGKIWLCSDIIWQLFWL